MLFFDYISNQPVVAEHAFHDISLDKLLGESVLRFLSLPCSVAEVQARQAFFRELENDAFLTQVRALKQRLTMLSQSHAMFMDANSRLETAFTAHSLCTRYCYLCTFILELALDNVFIRSLQAYIKNLMPTIGKIHAHVVAATPSKDNIQQFCLSFTRTNPESENMHVAMATLSAAPQLSFIDRLRKNATSLGFGDGLVSPPKQSRVHHYLADEILANFYPNEAGILAKFVQDTIDLLDMSLLDISNELDFYLEIYELIKKARDKDIAITYPTIVSARSFTAKNAYDITLLAKDSAFIVPNDIDFTAQEGAYFLTGANGGGKTTYLRTVAVNLLLALAGCPVFAEEASVFLFRKVFVHFPADERFLESGRLVEEKGRVDDILAHITPDSFIFFNETFSSTDPVVAGELIWNTADCIKSSAAFLLYVTHFYDVLDRGIASLHPEVDTDENGRRSFRIVKGYWVKSSFAVDILRKFGFTQAQLAERLGGKNV